MSDASATGPAREAIAGNRPLLLVEPTAAWIVERGEVHVFAVRTAVGAPIGGREYLFSVGAGGALFGVAPDDTGSALLAVGVPGTALRRRVDSDGPATVEAWVVALSTVVGEARPRHSRLVDPDVPIVLDDGAAVHGGDGDVLWVEVVEGAVHLNGAAAVAVDASHGPVPLSASAWLASAGPSQLALQPPPGGHAATTLQPFHRLVLAAVADQTRRAGEARAARSVARLAADTDAVDAGLAELLDTFDRNGGRAGTSSATRRRAGTADPLLAACRIVGESMGIMIQPPPASEHGQGNSMAAIARASRVRARQVVLDGEWWRSDNGPLVGFDAESGRPLALLPASRRAYDAIDPATGSRSRVTAAVASTVSPYAQSLYRAFPDRSIGAWDLVRFGLRGGRADVVTVLVMGVFGGLMALVVPIATGLLFNRFIPADDSAGVVQVAIALLASVAAIAAFQITRGIAVTRLGGRMDLALEAAVWDRLLNLPAPFFRHYSSGDLAMRATSISAMRRAMSGVVTTAVLGAVFSVFSFALLFVYDVGLAVVATLLIVAALAVAAVAFVSQVRDQRRASRARGQLAGLALEMLNGMPKLRVAGAEARAFSVWAHQVGPATARRAALVATQVTVVYAALPLLALVVIFPIASGRQGALTAGTFLAFNAALTQVLAAVIALGAALSAVAQVVPLYERVQPILTALPEADEARIDPGQLLGDIDLNDVTFRYVVDGPPILEHVSFRAQPGEFVALVGPSGSGKSTILRLLLGFETPESGSIHLDAQDIATLDLRAVRRQMGVVLQSGQLASGSIYQNIIGSLDLSIDDAWEAARMSGLDGDIRQMPMGMHTMVFEGGGGLSGGQRQRLLIARAIVSRPRIVLFDEATSALDNRTQAVVSASLEHLSATRIVIAHRLSTVVNADRIHVVVAGRIAESGRYEDLMAQQGHFAQLAARQLV